MAAKSNIDVYSITKSKHMSMWIKSTGGKEKKSKGNGEQETCECREHHDVKYSHTKPFMVDFECWNVTKTVVAICSPTSECWIHYTKQRAAGRTAKPKLCLFNFFWCRALRMTSSVDRQTTKATSAATTTTTNTPKHEKVHNI